MENSRKVNGKDENRHSQTHGPAHAGTGSAEQNLPVQLSVDNTLLGVDVRIPDPAGGDGWIAARVSLTTFAAASDGEILATGLSAETNRKPLARKESGVRDGRHFRSAVERWVSKYATMQ